MANPAYYKHPVTDRYSSTPWFRDEAIKRSVPLYRSDKPCADCGKTEPDRFVRCDTCQWCVMLDTTRYAKGEPVVAIKIQPEDSPIDKPGEWIDAPGVTESQKFETGVSELAQYGLDMTLSEQEKRDRGLRIFVPGMRLSSRPCQWGPHFRHEDADGECRICERERPNARQQIESRLGADWSRKDCERMGYVAYLGKPCVNGHEGWRFVNGNRCWHCFEVIKDPNRELTPMVPRAADQFRDGPKCDRATALERELTLYFGNPCKKGHSGWRRAKGQACYECSLPVENKAARVQLMCVQLNTPEHFPSKEAAIEKELPLYWAGEWRRTDGRAWTLPPKDLDLEFCAAMGYEVTYDDSTGWIPL